MVEIIIAGLSLIIAAITYWNARKLNLAQLEEIRKANKPLLFITHLNVYPDYVNQINVTDKWKVQELYGRKETTYIEYLGEAQKTKSLIEVEKIEKIVPNNRELVLNLLKNKEDVKINCCTTEIVLQNGGADLQAYQVDDVTICYSDKYKISLAGDRQIHQCYVEKGKTFNIWLTEITNNDQGTICDINKIIGVKSEFVHPKEDILDMELGRNFLNYEVLTISLTLINIRGDKSSYDIVVNVKNGRVTSRTVAVD